MSPQEWVEQINSQYNGARTMHGLKRAIKMAVREKVINVQEAGSLYKMIKADDEDLLTAIMVLESKYGLIKET